jgi:TetR/AcrR family transcriptional regulator, regulator of cefoperazone and chloramphenicol sensitivity
MLYMRSEPRGRRPLEDLTARARIRDAALVLFAEGGYSGTSIREVAKAAAVSPGLVQHHFGSKEGLREACDAHVLETLRANATKKLERTEYDAAFVAALYEASQPIMRYMARGLTEGWPGSTEWFDESARATERWLGSMWPERYPPGSERLRQAAATSVAMSLGVIILHAHLTRWWGVDSLDGRHQPLIGAAMIEMHTSMGEYFGSEAGRILREALAEYRRSISSTGTHSDDG